VLKVPAWHCFTKEVMRTAARSKPRPGQHGGPSGPRATNPGWSKACIQNIGVILAGVGVTTGGSGAVDQRSQ
jgi:hypothetical protein